MNPQTDTSISSINDDDASFGCIIEELSATYRKSIMKPKRLKTFWDGFFSIFDNKTNGSKSDKTSRFSRAERAIEKENLEQAKKVQEHHDRVQQSIDSRGKLTKHKINL